MKSGPRLWIGWLALVLLQALAPRALGAQVDSVASANPADSAAAAAPGPSPASAVDSPVDRADYIVGPGDVLGISLFGDLNRMLTVPVTPEGTVVIPGIGVAEAQGLSLQAAEARIRERVLRLYRNVEVRVTLMQVRPIKVFVVGEVAQPGVRLATAMTRVSEVVEPRSPLGVVRRNIQLRRAGAPPAVVDLVRYLQLGEIEANPRLREGDALVLVPTDETVRVVGRVAFPGEYEFRPGESLAEILRIANGGLPFLASAADSIRLSRSVGDEERVVTTMHRDAALGGAGEALTLQPFDAIYVAERANFRLEQAVTVLGQVARPGTYPIDPGTTTVRDLLEMAGGLTPEASLLTATLERQRPALGAVSTDALELPLELLDQDALRARQVLSGADRNRVVVDFEKVVQEGGSAYDQPLQEGDVLTIPRQRNEVAVLGGVRLPGLLTHTPGQGVREYIALAGGYSKRADRNDVVVIKARHGSQLQAEEVQLIEPGDQILVPMKVPMTALERLTTVQNVVSTISGMILTALALGRIF